MPKNLVDKWLKPFFAEINEFMLFIFWLGNDAAQFADLDRVTGIGGVSGRKKYSPS